MNEKMLKEYIRLCLLEDKDYIRFALLEEQLDRQMRDEYQGGSDSIAKAAKEAGIPILTLKQSFEKNTGHWLPHMNEKLLRQYIRICLFEDFAGRQELHRDFDAEKPVSRNDIVDMMWGDGGDIEAIGAFKLAMARGRELKKLYAKLADRAFLNKVITIHWADASAIENLIKDGSSKDEISCRAYLPEDIGEYDSSLSWTMRTGLVVRGHITLLANDQNDIYSGGGEQYKKADPQRAKMSGANKGVFAKIDKYIGADAVTPSFVLDKDDWRPKAFGLTIVNEALVDNWNPVAIVSEREDDLERVSGLASDLGIKTMSFSEFVKEVGK